jgi:hypothetical protein
MVHDPKETLRAYVQAFETLNVAHDAPQTKE